ncbi:hypothetical protein HU200_028626 [Digitaria exilis]|uniref:Aromatic-L-amino-acid decarboxylase n=1 Tax=Digitaria exilis TaxID=1010633 RepID=A0A835EQ10_9POAL|nr:hypothetical protein HU200_028626 [Digitaria exilis]
MGSLDTNPNGLHLPPTAIKADEDDDVFRPLNPDDVRSYLHKAVDFIADYLNSVETLPVLPDVEPGYLRHLLNPTPPPSSAPFDVAMKELKSSVLPGMTHWASPNFFAYFPATNSAAAIAGDLLASAMNTVGFTWQASPASTELEALALDWLAQLLHLPPSFITRGVTGGGGSVILGTTSEAMLVTLVAARDAALRRTRHGGGVSVSGAGGLSRLTVYASDQTHATFFKVCHIAGVDTSTSSPPSQNQSTRSTRRSFGASWRQTWTPAWSRSTCVPRWAPRRRTPWTPSAPSPTWRVGSAHGSTSTPPTPAAACVCPEFRHHLDGVERVDSISMSPHKWLLTCLDCTCLWVRDTCRLTASLETKPEYLKNDASESGHVTDVKDMQVGVGHRFRGLKLWMVMRTYGVSKLQQHIRSDVAMAMAFEQWVMADERFEVVVKRSFALVCFRIRARGGDMAEEDADVASRELMARMNMTGKVLVAHTVVGGRFVLRFAVGSSMQEERHVRAAWELIKKTTGEILNGQAS